MKPYKYLRTMYAALDRTVYAKLKKLAAQGKPASCRPGCTHCCYIQVVCSVPEAIVLLDGAERAGWRLEEHTETLAQRLVDTLLPGMTEGVWSRSRSRPCPFLTQKGRCGGYTSRPVACRLYSVVSKPELCDPSTPEFVSVINLEMERAVALQYLQQIAEAIGLSSVGWAPLPVALDVAIAYSRKGVQAANELLVKYDLDTNEKCIAAARQRAAEYQKGMGF